MTAAVAAPKVGDVLLDNRWVTVDLVEGRRGDGSTYPHHRIRAGSGRGAFVVVVADGLVAMVRQPRPAAGLVSSLELPGGGTADDSAEEALREACEETGLPPSAIRRVTFLGFMNQAAGFVSNRGTTWLVEASLAALAEVPEWESCATAEWMPLLEAMLHPDITGAETLAAFHMTVRHLAATGRLDLSGVVQALSPVRVLAA